MQIREMIFFVLCLGEYCSARWLLLPQMTDPAVSWGQRLRLWIPTLAVGALFAWNGLGSLVSTGVIYFSPMISGALYLIFFRKYAGLVLVWEIFSLLLLSLVKCLVLILEGFFYQMNIVEMNYSIRTWADVAAELLLTALLLLLGKLLKAKGISLLAFSRRYWIWLAISALVGTELMAYVMLNSLSGMSFSMLLLNVILIFASFFLLVILLLSFVLSQARMERRLLDCQQSAAREYYGELQRQYERLGKLNHDIRNERAGLYHFLEAGETEKAMEFLKEKQAAASPGGRVWTGDSMLDFMISLKQAEMEKRGIAFQLDSDFSRFPTSQEDCCVLLGNLLDNAIEASEQCGEGERWIEMELRQHNDMFWLRIRNASQSIPKLQGGRFVTTKGKEGGHGWGLQNVEDLAGRYGGTVKYDYSEKFFEVRIVFWKLEK